jgi:hypothetical protein
MFGYLVKGGRYLIDHRIRGVSIDQQMHQYPIAITVSVQCRSVSECMVKIP